MVFSGYIWQLFFVYDTKSTSNKSKNEQVDLIKLKKLYTTKEIINKMKRQPTEWDKIFANYVSEKGLIFKICKECTQLYNNNNNRNPI